MGAIRSYIGGGQEPQNQLTGGSSSKNETVRNQPEGSKEDPSVDSPKARNETKRYFTGVAQRTAFEPVGGYLGLKHQGILLETETNSPSSQKKQKIVSLGNSEDESPDKYLQKEVREVSKEEYKELKHAAREVKNEYGAKHSYAQDYLLNKGNCQDHVRATYEKTGQSFPESDKIVNQSFNHQPPKSEEERAFELESGARNSNPFSG